MPESWLTPSTKFASKKKLVSFTDLSRPLMVNTLSLSGNELVTNKGKSHLKQGKSFHCLRLRSPVSIRAFSLVMVATGLSFVSENRCIRITFILAKQI